MLNKIALGAGVVLIGLLGFQQWANGRLRTKNAEMGVMLEQAVEANLSQHQTIIDLQTANEECHSKITTSVEAQNVALVELNEKQGELSKAARERVRLLGQIRGSSLSCQSLLDTDVNIVCSDLAETLRENQLGLTL